MGSVCCGGGGITSTREFLSGTPSRIAYDLQIRATIRWLLTLVTLLLLGVMLRTCDCCLEVRGPICDHRTLRVMHGYVAVVTEANNNFWTPGIQTLHLDRHDLEFVLGRETSLSGTSYYLPLLIPMLATALPAGLMWRAAIIRRRKSRTGLCPACGYDRRGLAVGVKCPECGSAA
jgi:hypothetical protein